MKYFWLYAVSSVVCLALGIQAAHEHPEGVPGCDAKCSCGTQLGRRLIGGTQLNYSKYPWTVQLLREGMELFCDGALINDRYVLTVVFCVQNSDSDITVRLLELDKSAGELTVTRKVIQTIVHPQYDESKYVNDIVLLKLDWPVDITSVIRPVCLPDVNHNFDNKDAIVANWYLLKEGDVTSDIIQATTVSIISNPECRPTRYKSEITEDILCAGLLKPSDKVVCQGDSGGPLIVNEGRFKLAGVASLAPGCMKGNEPGVYTRVSKFVDWIKINTRDACYCSM